MGGSGEDVTPIFTPDIDSEPIQYAVTAYMTGGDATLCGLVLLDGSSTLGYSGPLLLLNTQMLTSTGPLPIHFTLPSGYAASENTSCFVDLIFTGRNQSANVGEGYNFTAHLPLQFFVPATASIPTEGSAAPQPVVVLEQATTTTTTDAPATPVIESSTTTQEIAPVPAVIPVTDIPQQPSPDAVLPPLDTTPIPES